MDASDLDYACGSGTIEPVLSAAGLVPGDLDGMNGVQFADFLHLAGNFGESGVGYAGGDIDCSGRVDFADFLVLSGNFGEPADAFLASVPEPIVSFAIPLCAGVIGIRRRRRACLGILQNPSVG